jgi:hypothetical protein
MYSKLNNNRYLQHVSPGFVTIILTNLLLFSPDRPPWILKYYHKICGTLLRYNTYILAMFIFISVRTSYPVGCRNKYEKN